MDMTWVTDRIAVGGGIWNEIKMIDVASEGVTHIINMQIEFDERELALPFNIQVFWNPTEDDFTFKPSDLFQGAVEFARRALEQPDSRIFIHCAAGVHRAPMMTLALLCALGWDLGDAMKHIQRRRPVVDFAEVYVRSVKEFMKGYAPQLARTE
jgi:protein-tyrosine phosphatase